MVACPDLAGLSIWARVFAWHAETQYSPHADAGSEPEPTIREELTRHCLHISHVVTRTSKAVSSCLSLLPQPSNMGTVGACPQSNTNDGD